MERWTSFYRHVYCDLCHHLFLIAPMLCFRKTVSFAVKIIMCVNARVYRLTIRSFLPTMDFGRRLSKGLISPLSPAIPQTDSYFPDGPSNPSVKPLPSRRKRTLTCTYRPGVDPDQVTIDQLRAPLFSKLPLELRLLIWEAALGGGHLHIRPNPDDRKLEHLRCKDPSHAKHDCWHVFGWDRSSKSIFYDYGLPAKIGQNPFKPVEGLLALPLTCRRM